MTTGDTAAPLRYMHVGLGSWGGQWAQVTLADNLQCCALLFAAVESADTGLPLDVQGFLAAGTARTSGAIR